MCSSGKLLGAVAGDRQIVTFKRKKKVYKCSSTKVVTDAELKNHRVEERDFLAVAYSILCGKCEAFCSAPTHSSKDIYVCEMKEANFCDS